MAKRRRRKPEPLPKKFIVNVERVTIAEVDIVAMDEDDAMAKAESLSEEDIDWDDGEGWSDSIIRATSAEEISYGD